MPPAVPAVPPVVEVDERDLGVLVARARRLMAPDGRRATPSGRRATPSGRRATPSGRRATPGGRRATPGGRRLLGIAGAPAAGKSTVAAAVTAALAPDAVLVPMDGFHLAEAELHRLGRHARKGAVDTFDAAGFACLLDRLRRPDGETVYAPRFDRDLEESIAGAIAVPPDLPLVVIEGNYLLVDSGPWARIRALLDEAWYVELDERVRLDRLTARHVAHGRPPDVAAARARGTDQRNAELIATTRPRADLVVHVSPSPR